LSMAQPLRPNRPDEQIPGARLLSTRIRHWLSVYSAIKIVPTQKNLSGSNQRAANYPPARIAQSRLTTRRNPLKRLADVGANPHFGAQFGAGSPNAA